MDPMPGEYDW